MQYEIPVRSLAFALNAAAKSASYRVQTIDVREHACTGTDGSILLRITDPEQVAPEPLQLPIAAARWIVKNGKRAKAAAIVRTGGQLHVTVDGLSTGFGYDPEAPFPHESIEQLLDNARNSERCEPSEIGRDYVERLAAASKALHPFSSVVIQPRARDSLIVSWPGLAEEDGARAGGLVMPFRCLPSAQILPGVRHG